MNGKQVMLLTLKNNVNNGGLYKKNTGVKSLFVVLIMALVFSCVSVSVEAATTETVSKAAVQKTDSKQEDSTNKKDKKTTKKSKQSKKTVKKSKASKKTKVAKKSKASKKTKAVKKSKTSKKTKITKTSKKSKTSKKTKTTKKSRKKKTANKYVVYGTPSHNSFKSYMSYKAVSSSSAQGKLQARATTDKKTGIRKVDGRYCVALGSYYCKKIGTKFDLVMSNGSIVKCILADQKANSDTDSKNQKTPDGSIAEFLVDMNRIPHKAKIMGNMSYASKELRGNIDKIRIYK